MIRPIFRSQTPRARWQSANLVNKVANEVNRIAQARGEELPSRSAGHFKNEGANWGSNQARPPVSRASDIPELSVAGSIPVSRSLPSF
jgi:hypothetical protein